MNYRLLAAFPAATLLAGGAFAAGPTFSRDVAPLLRQNGANCHRQRKADCTTDRPTARVGQPRRAGRRPDGPDAFQCFVTPLGFDADRCVEIVGFHPGYIK